MKTQRGAFLNSVSLTRRWVGLRLGFSKKNRFRLGLGFAVSVWVGFRFLFFEKFGSQLGFESFQNFNKFTVISRNILMKKIYTIYIINFSEIFFRKYPKINPVFPGCV
jgi:hypothetical protein